MNPQDAVPSISVYELLDLRRVPYKDTVAQLRERFGSTEEHSLRVRIELSGLEPLIVSMREPLVIEEFPAVDGTVPQVFTGKVDLYDSPRENFRVAKEQFSALLGKGFDPKPRRNKQNMADWWWGGATVQIQATFALAPTSQGQSMLKRLLTPAEPPEPPPIECRVRIDLTDRSKKAEFVPKDNFPAKADEIAHRYNDLVGRVGSANPPTEDELVLMLREVGRSCMDLGMSKAYEMSKITLDQDLRYTHLQSLLPPEKRGTYPRYSGPPSPEKLEEARNRL